MPSAGRILRVSIAGVVAAASMGVAASSASAAPVWLWACHGPSGQSIASPAGKADTLDGRTSLSGCGVGESGYKLSFASATPAAGSSASVTIPVPAGLTATAVKLDRTTRGFDGSTGITYTATAGNTTVDSSADPKTGAVPVSGSANSVTLNLSCSSSCTGSPELDIAGVAVQVEDNTAPSGGVNWNSPVDKEMVVTPAFTDSGVGLDRAEITIAGQPGVRKVVRIGNCNELSPADATNDRPLDPTACITGVKQGTDLNPLPQLPQPAEIVLWRDVLDANGNLIFDPLRLPEGTFSRTVTVYDAAGNATPITGDVEVWHPPSPVSTRTLNISTASVTEQPGTNNPSTRPDGAVGGAQANQCRTPRLSVTLRSKPVRITKGTPTLQYKKSYRFTGRLTCVINGKRQSAPKRTKVSILNTVGKKTVRKPNTAIRAKGAVDLKLAFVSSRTVVFRYTNASGQKSEVKIKVRVTKKKK